MNFSAKVNLPAQPDSTGELVSSVFGEAANEMGKLLAEQIRQQRQQPFNSREKANLKSHISAVKDAEPSLEMDEPTLDQQENLAEFVNKASQKNPNNDKAGSTKWRSIFSEILQSNEEQTLSVLRDLNKYDIEYIHSIGTRLFPIPEENSDKYMTMGLIKSSPFYGTARRKIFFLYLVSASFAYIGFVFSFFFSEFGSYSSDLFEFFVQLPVLSILFLFSIPVILVYFIVFLYFSKFAEKLFEFTSFGKAIKNKIDLYYK